MTRYRPWPSALVGTEEVDQLLTVSLREEDVCRALEELDRSLVQARTALQATYAEVQRLLALRQQVDTHSDR